MKTNTLNLQVLVSNVAIIWLFMTAKKCKYVTTESCPKHITSAWSKVPTMITTQICYNCDNHAILNIPIAEKFKWCKFLYVSHEAWRHENMYKNLETSNLLWQTFLIKVEKWKELHMTLSTSQQELLQGSINTRDYNI